MSFVIKNDVLLKDFTTIKVGGPAKFFAEVFSIEDMQKALAFADNKRLPFIVLGNGSNIFFDDRGYNGLVIHNRIIFIRFNEQKVFVGAGNNFAHLARQCTKQKLSGIGFAQGIPGSVGGAIFMNAGIDDEDVSQNIEDVHYVMPDGSKKVFKKNEIDFSYRHSSFQKIKGAIVAGTFFLSPYNHQKEKKDRDRLSYRIRSQPYKEYSAGCIFQNPQPDLSAGYLIEKCRLKGKKIGGAKVSQRHANFIINDNQATAQDILELIEHIQAEVKKKSEIILQTEVRYIPYQNA